MKKQIFSTNIKKLITVFTKVLCASKNQMTIFLMNHFHNDPKNRRTKIWNGKLVWSLKKALIFFQFYLILIHIRILGVFRRIAQVFETYTSFYNTDWISITHFNLASILIFKSGKTFWAPIWRGTHIFNSCSNLGLYYHLQFNLDSTYEKKKSPVVVAGLWRF